jgi:hypothetical protein
VDFAIMLMDLAFVNLAGKENFAKKTVQMDTTGSNVYSNVTVMMNKNVIQ